MCVHVFNNNNNIGRRMANITGDARESTFLFQQLSVALQRGNVLSFQNTQGRIEGKKPPRLHYQKGLPSLLLPPLPSLPLSFSLPSPPLEVGPSNSARGLGERCRLSQWGLGRSPSRNQIWCILTLKSDIWWQQF